MQFERNIKGFQLDKLGSYKQKWPPTQNLKLTRVCPFSLTGVSHVAGAGELA